MSRFYCGACGWNYLHWKGPFYPEGLPQSKWLEHYAGQFDTVEINNSFYRLPEKATFEKWRDRTPDGFVFAVKASRYVTHLKRLTEPEEPLTRLLTHSEGLGDKRGPILYQLPPSLAMDLERLEYFLKLLPKDLRHVFEFRNDSWHNERLWSLLAEYGVAYCIMDSPGVPLHLVTTGGFSYVRMHSGGEKTHGNYTASRLRTWARRCEDLLTRGDVYVYFNNDNNCCAVRNALDLRRAVSGG